MMSNRSSAVILAPIGEHKMSRRRKLLTIGLIALVTLAAMLAAVVVFLSRLDLTIKRGYIKGGFALPLAGPYELWETTGRDFVIITRRDEILSSTEAQDEAHARQHFAADIVGPDVIAVRVQGNYITALERVHNYREDDFRGDWYWIIRVKEEHVLGQFRKADFDKQCLAIGISSTLTPAEF